MINFKIYTSTAQIPPEWNNLTIHDVLLQTAYLKALEEGAPQTISLYYIGVYFTGNLVGIALVQRVKLYAKDMFRSESASKSIAILKN